MRIALRLVAALVLALVAYACAHRTGAATQAANSSVDRLADPADPTRATISGLVIREHSEDGVAGVTVRLERSDGAEPIETTSGDDGSFDFPPQPPGSYTVRLAADPATVHGATVGAGERWRVRLVAPEAVELVPEGAFFRHRNRLG